MIKAKLYSKSIKGKRKIENLIHWQDYNYGHELLDSEKETIDLYKSNKLKDKSIRVFCQEGNYLKVPHFYKTYYTISSDDNYAKEELAVYTNESNEFYIPINEYEISFNKSSSLFRPYIIDEISNNENVIKRYCIVVSISYKDNGKLNNNNFEFDYSVRINKVFEKNITYGLLDYAFYGYCIWVIMNLVLKNRIFEQINNPTTIIVFLTYLIYIFVKTKYVGHTIINKLLFLLKIKKRDYYTNSELRNMFKKYKD